MWAVIGVWEFDSPLLEIVRARIPEMAQGKVGTQGFVHGTWTVDESARTVIHHVEGSLWPNYVGTDQQRPATLEGGRLTLSDGKTFRVVWERSRR